MQSDKGFTVTTDTPLRRSDFAVEGDFLPTILSRAFYVSYEVERRFEADRQRPHTVIVSFMETANNIADLNAITFGQVSPENLILITKTKSGRVVSKRTFSSLRLKTAGASYAMHGDHEVPLQRFVFDCYMSDAEFPKS
jgi:hypothetical protein